MKKIIFTSVLLLLTIGLSIAQDFEVAPIEINFSANPGESESKTITIKNHGNKQISLVINLKDYIVYKNGKRNILPSGASKNSIAKWITLNPSFLKINPNKSKTVQVNFQAPNDDYTSKWGILSVTSAKEQTSFSADKNLQAGINLYGMINVHLKYTPSAEINKNKRVKISNLKETTSKIDSLRKFTVHVDNLGNTMTECKLYLIASNLKTLKEKKFQTKKITAYPQATRTVELSFPKKELSKGKYALSAILDYGSNEALEGTQITIEVKE